MKQKSKVLSFNAIYDLDTYGQNLLSPEIVKYFRRNSVNFNFLYLYGQIRPMKIMKSKEKFYTGY